MIVGGPGGIGPTAHYTAHVWARNGLSHPELATWRGRVMFEALRPVMCMSGALGGPTLEAHLLARHHAIDVLLRRLIDSEEASQVVELACGLSPRGWRFAGDHGDRLTYVEADLPAMAQRKREALRRLGSLSATHRVASVDVLEPAGEHSLEQLVSTLKPEAGLIVITEGLLGYLQRPALEGLWARIASQLERFSVGHYLSDLHLASGAGRAVDAFRLALGVFVGASVPLHHFSERGEAQDALRRAGFTSAIVADARDPGGGAALRHDGDGLTCVLHARVAHASPRAPGRPAPAQQGLRS